MIAELLRFVRRGLLSPQTSQAVLDWQQDEAAAIVTKACTKCRVPKPLTKFYRNRASADGRQHHCRQCQNTAVSMSKGRVR